MDHPRPWISLAPLSLPDHRPTQFFRDAAQAGFTHVAGRVIGGNPTVTPSALPSLIGATEPVELARIAKGEGLTVLELEFLLIEPGLDVAACEPAFTAGSMLGAKWIVAGCDAPDAGRASDMLARLAAAAAPYGLRILIEFVPFRVTNTLAAARSLAAACGQNVGILVDALHLRRSGGQPSDIKAFEPGLFPYLQLCDGPPADPPSIDARIAETRCCRLPPGDGAFDLAGLLRAVPGVGISLEVPNAELLARMGPVAYAAQLLMRTRSLISAEA